MWLLFDVCVVCLCDISCLVYECCVGIFGMCVLCVVSGMVVICVFVYFVCMIRVAYMWGVCGYGICVACVECVWCVSGL